MYSNLDLALMIDEEGMDYVLTHKISLDKIEDEETRKCAVSVYDAMGRLESLLANKVSKEDKETYLKLWG